MDMLKPAMIYYEDKIKVFTTAIKYLQFVSFFPRNGGIFGPKLYMKFVLLFSTGIPVLVGMIGHFYQSYLHGNFNAMVHQFYFFNFVNMIVSVILMFFYKGDAFLNLLYVLSESKETSYIEYTKAITRINHFSRIAVYCINIVLIINAMDCLKRDALCIAEFSHDPHFVCGLRTPLWYPVEINGKLKPVFAISEVVIGFMYAPAVVAMTSFYFMCDLIAIRIEYLIVSLKKLKFKEEMMEETRSQMLHCVRTYTVISRMVSEMNQSLGVFLAPTHNAYNNLMIGICAYLIIEVRCYSFILELGIWIGVQWISCSCGQHLENANDRLRRELYNIPWYDMSPSLRSTFKILQAHVGLPLQLKIKPLLDLNMNTFTQVLKGTYSFLMFLLKMRSE